MSAADLEDRDVVIDFGNRQGDSNRCEVVGGDMANMVEGMENREDLCRSTLLRMKARRVGFVSHGSKDQDAD
jgi:hypothetical protein